MNLGLGWFAVGVLALAAFVAVQVWANEEEDGWRDDRATVSATNVDIAVENVGRPAAAERDDEPYPDEPFVVAYTTETAIGAALAVAVVGAVVVLLATIAARLPERRT